MKTLKQVKSEIAHLSKEPVMIKELPKDRKKREREVSKLRWCALYLEKSPTKEFVTKQLETKRKENERILKGFQKWLNNTPEAQQVNDPAKQKAMYNKEMRTRVIRNQISNLEYILS